VTSAAVAAARAVGYQNAGTVEFIADASEGLRPDRIWFMEMNTRLQVEHPVTEAVTGLDLVEWQFRIAAGEPLPLAQEQILLNGHAVEARLYAEAPDAGFLPSTGLLAHFRLPQGVRTDAGYAEGSEVTPYYDAMLAKLVAHAPSREAAVAELAEACDAVEAWPVRTNAGFLARCLDAPDFIAGDVDTGFIEERLGELAEPGEPSQAALAAAATAARLTGENALAEEAPSPWRELAGFRLNAPADPTVHLYLDGHQVATRGEPGAAARSVLVAADETLVVFEHGEAFVFSQRPPAGPADPLGGDGQIRSPLPGRVAALAVAPGDQVEKGQTLLVIEAMKMEHALNAPFDAEVETVAAALGAQVTEGAVLIALKPRTA
jgi:acetyl/propionyl-CoA carboxylase alpha subunit